jgi:beta-phosphoglucomutase-like phosphatase (HAD superfamily)
MEDATNGLQAAKNGGMRCIALTTTRGADQLQGADLIVNGYPEIDLLGWLEGQQSQGSGAA